MSPSDSVSVFAEGTFEEQLRELLEYTARGIPNEERTALLQSLQDVMKTENASLDEDRRRATLELVLKNIKGVGQGTDQGMCGHNRSRSLLTTQQRLRDSSTSCTHIYSLCGKSIRRKQDNM
jgi:hypothetical protein